VYEEKDSSSSSGTERDDECFVHPRSTIFNDGRLQYDLHVRLLKEQFQAKKWRRPAGKLKASQPLSKDGSKRNVRRLIGRRGSANPKLIDRLGDTAEERRVVRDNLRHLIQLRVIHVIDGKNIFCRH
jgi:hypothetical protein